MAKSEKESESEASWRGMALSVYLLCCAYQRKIIIKLRRRRQKRRRTGSWRSVAWRRSNNGAVACGGMTRSYSDDSNVVANNGMAAAAKLSISIKASSLAGSSINNISMAYGVMAGQWRRNSKHGIEVVCSDNGVSNEATCVCCVALGGAIIATAWHDVVSGGASKKISSMAAGISAKAAHQRVVNGENNASK